MNEIATMNPGTVARQDFGGQQITTTAETSSTAVAAQMQAQIQARYIMALQRPRDWMQVRAELLRECQRPGFAESAEYAKPIGGGKTAVGLSIRFAEAALRCMRNIAPEVMTIYDDNRKRILRVSVTDIENNVPFTQDITIEKTVERKSVRPGQQVLSSRTNSQGQLTYLIEANEGDLDTKQGAQISKTLRTLALRLLPGDIQDDCRAQINTTLSNRAATDPDAERKKLVDAFAALSIQPKSLEEYLGHAVGQTVPAEIVDLRRVYQAIKSGECTWVEVLSAKLGSPDGDDDKPKRSKVRDKIKQAAAVDNASEESSTAAEPPPSVPSPREEEPPPWSKHLEASDSEEAP